MLFHGNELLEARNANYPTGENRVRQHTVKATLDTLVGAQPTPGGAVHASVRTGGHQFVGYLLFDAWIGNMDRHHINWGVIQPFRQVPIYRYLAPTYDHGSSLGRELTDARRRQILAATNPGHNLAAYAYRGRGRFYDEAIHATKALRPIDAFEVAARRHPTVAAYWLDQLQAVQPTDVQAVLDALPPAWCSAEARAFSFALLRHNRDALLALPYYRPTL